MDRQRAAAASPRTLALALALLAAALVPCRAKLFDACEASTAVARGDSFVLGLALVPGVTDALLANISAKFSQGLCSPDAQTELTTNYNAAFAVYQLRVDRLMVLKMPYPDIVLRMNHTPPTMALAAFRGNYTSPAVYIASGDTNITKGAGFVVSVALLARFDKGLLSYLQWYDQTCNECGGKTSALCIHSVRSNTYACSTPLTSCSCFNETEGATRANCSFADTEFLVCATAVNTAWLGSDRNQAVFRTGSQVQRLNAYSIVDLFNTGKDAFFRIKDYVYANVGSAWGNITSDIQAQGPDFEGGLGQQAAAKLPPSPPPPGNGTSNSTPPSAPPPPVV